MRVIKKSTICCVCNDDGETENICNDCAVLIQANIREEMITLQYTVEKLHENED